MTRRSLLMLTGGLAALSIGYFFHRQSHEYQLRAASERVVDALRFDASRESSELRRSRVERELTALLDPGVVARVPDLPELAGGRDALLRLTADTAEFETIDVALSDASISVDDPGTSAILRARATLTAAGRTRQLRDTRSLSVSWARPDGSWRITSVDVAAATHEHPEARP